MGILWGSTPEQDQLSLLVGSSLLGGQNVQQQLGSIGPAVAPYMAQQAQNKQTEAMKQSTLQMLQANDQDLAQAVQAGAMTPQDAVKMSFERKTSTQKAQQPKMSFQKLEDGTYGFADETSGTFKPLGKSDAQKLPAIAEEYNWAKQNGFNGSPQEYQTWKANLSKQKGMTVSYDPVNGFQMTQGDVDKAPPKLTEAQSKDINFLTRAKKAETDLAPVENELTSWAQKRAEGLPMDIGNYTASPSYQKAQQAGREILAIILRKDTGAAVTPSEFDTYGKIYLPQPGDGPETIAAKRISRQTAIKAIQSGLGPLAPPDDNATPQTTNQPVPAEDYFK